ncbi:MAG TPA: carboxylase, partial [Candidatus Syntrophosphaera thermopropionivorans]|jgi:biotin carboxyl carrier protein|nr:carboxylase [Candidatus Syntrophosphaera thermopropionivorans]
MPEEMKPITLEEVKRQQELCEKAKAGLLVEPPVKKQVPKPEGLRQFDVFVDDEYFLVEVSEKGVPHIVHSAKVASNPQVQPSQTSNPQSSPQPVKNNPQPVPNQSSVQTASTAVEGTPVTAPMPGMLVRYEKKVGDKVKVGETLLVLEAMKMYNNIPSPVEGTVVSTPLNAGDSVGKGDVMIVVKPD